MAAFLHAHAKASPIHWAWSDRREGAASGSPLQLTLRYEPTWQLPDAARLAREGATNAILLSLGRRSSVILGLMVPFATVDPAFAAWERAFCASLGIALAQSRWSLAWVPQDSSHPTWKFEQGRYLRQDWAPDRQAAPLAVGPWTGLVDTLLGARVTKDQEYDLRDALQAQPTGPVTAALLRQMGALKGAPLERGKWMLKRLAE